MTGSSRRRRDQRHRQRHRAAEAARRDAIVKAVVERLPAELHADIHRRLPFLRRLAFASVCTATGHMLRPEAPWLLLPGAATKEKKKATNEDSDEEEPEEETATPPVTAGEEKSTVLSMAEGGSEAPLRTPGLALADRVIIGSTDGWLVTADDRGALRMANPATFAEAPLPAITTIPFLSSTGGGSWFVVDVEPFVRVRFGGAPPPVDDEDWGASLPRTYTLTATQMRQKFYRKVVLSSTPSPRSYDAMLIPDRYIGAPAFTTAENGTGWRMAPSITGVEDAIHHDGRFVSVSYAGDVEAWQLDATTGEYASKAVAPRLAFGDGKHPRRKYLAASPHGRLMAVLKHAVVEENEHVYRRSKVTRVVFEVRVLDAAAGRWKAVADIGDAALFVGVNGTVCVRATEYPGVEAGCVYFTDDEVGEACLRRAQGVTTVRYGYDEADETELRATGVFSLKEGKVTQRIAEKSDDKQPRWPPAAWFTPSFL
ncbi:unnamed protein product [Urochloa decumbens]|uniref:KIB1-4 beta-propeller domain-containing protein n=1 Tax=Urochloa decumbens TaxID=240449 RepID=A0ABC9D980_9POAL